MEEHLINFPKDYVERNLKEMCEMPYISWKRNISLNLNVEDELSSMKNYKNVRDYVIKLGSFSHVVSKSYLSGRIVWESFDVGVVNMSDYLDRFGSYIDEDIAHLLLTNKKIILRVIEENKLRSQLSATLRSMAILEANFLISLEKIVEPVAFYYARIACSILHTCRMDIEKYFPQLYISLIDWEVYFSDYTMRWYGRKKYLDTPHEIDCTFCLPAYATDGVFNFSYFSERIRENSDILRNLQDAICPENRKLKVGVSGYDVLSRMINHLNSEDYIFRTDIIMTLSYNVLTRDCIDKKYKNFNWKCPFDDANSEYKDRAKECRSKELPRGVPSYNNWIDLKTHVRKYGTDFESYTSHNREKEYSEVLGVSETYHKSFSFLGSSFDCFHEDF